MTLVLREDGDIVSVVDCDSDTIVLRRLKSDVGFNVQETLRRLSQLPTPKGCGLVTNNG